MYNLLVSGNEKEWTGEPFVLERPRCVSAAEYTAPDIVDRFSDLNPEQIREIRSLPCVFAYEKTCSKDPKFGALLEVRRRGAKMVEMIYRLIPCQPFVTADDLDAMREPLGVARMELYRTHWAVKDVDLAWELGRRGIELPDWVPSPRMPLDITSHRFDLALSFPGEHRSYVEDVAEELVRQLGPDACFYDKNYEALLARPNLDLLLQDIYGERSALVVAFVCAEYDAKKWCGIEWQRIRERRAAGGEGDIMFVRIGEGDVEGMSALDGYLDARSRGPKEMAALIVQRAQARAG